MYAEEDVAGSGFRVAVDLYRTIGWEEGEFVLVEDVVGMIFGYVIKPDDQNKRAKATLDQEASDVVEFLAWASEPHLEDRNRAGIRVILFLIAMAGLMYAVKRQVWSNLH